MRRKRKSTIDQEKFILEYLADHVSADIYDQEFHDLFFERFGGQRDIHFFGSCPVHKAQRLLATMYKAGIINRYRIPLSGHEVGFRNWVYSYTLRGK